MEPKPCPFCEKGASLRYETYDMGWNVERWVECDECGAKGEVIECEEGEDYWYADGLAIEKWNTRADTSLLRRVKKAYKELNDSLVSDLELGGVKNLLKNHLPELEDK